VQRRGGQHHDERQHRDGAGQTQLAGDHQHRGRDEQQRERREHPVGGERIEPRERHEQHGEQGRVEVGQLRRSVVDVAARHEGHGGVPESVEIDVNLAHVR
jgi:hypothetical protein